MKYEVGRTCEDRAILVDGDAAKGVAIQNDFALFSERDLFDAILALEYFGLSESRRPNVDQSWLMAISLTHFYLWMRLSPEAARQQKNELGLHSAFTARDYGRERIHPHFRFL